MQPQPLWGEHAVPQRAGWGRGVLLCAGMYRGPVPGLRVPEVSQLVPGHELWHQRCLQTQSEPTHLLLSHQVPARRPSRAV